MISRENSKAAAATIARNSFWIGVEATAAVLTAFATSVAVARTFGPVKLGYFSFIMLISGASASLGSLGIPITTAKYMAESLGRGEPGLARAVFFFTLRAQTIVSLCIALIGGILILTVIGPAYRLISLVIIAGIVPQMIAYIPSQANNAAERCGANVPGSVAGMCAYALGVTLTLVFGWGLFGVAFSILLCHITEASLKLYFMLPWVLAHPASSIPDVIRKSMFSFARNSFALMAVNFVVWDRSDVLFIKWLNGDIRQVAFFILPFSLVEKALLAPQAFCQSIGATVYAERARDPEKMLRIAETALKYVLLAAIPILCGLATLSKDVIILFYGAQYAQAGGILATMAILALGKSTLIPMQAVHGAMDRLGTVLRAVFAGAIVNVVLDVLLVPRFGAVGAALGNGAAQICTAAWLWHHASTRWQIRPDYKAIGKLLACGAAMSVAVVPVSWLLPPVAAVPLGVMLGAAVFLIMLRAMTVLSVDDQTRLLRAWPSAAWVRPLVLLMETLVSNRQPVGVSERTQPVYDATPAHHRL